MKKLTLDLENLVVESFHTVKASNGAAGTVRAHIYDDQIIIREPVTEPRTFDVSCYCETQNCVTRITCYSCESCRTCGFCIPF